MTSRRDNYFPPSEGPSSRADQQRRVGWVRATCWFLLTLAALSILLAGIGAEALRDFLDDHVAALAIAALGLSGLALAPLLEGAKRPWVEFDSRVQVVHAGPEASLRAWLAAAERVRRARHSIRVLQTCLPHAAPPDGRNEGAAILYEAILERAAAGADYVHLFQAQSPEAFSSELKEPALRNHLELAFARRSAGRDEAVARIQLKLAAPRLPFGFIIVDDECVIWQLDELTDGDAALPGGAMFIEAGDGTAVQDLLGLFKAMDGRAVLMLDNPLRRMKSAPGSNSSSRPPTADAPQSPPRVLDWSTPERQSK